MAQIKSVLLAALLGRAHGLRKASLRDDVVERGNASASVAVAWVAGTYGECIRNCGPARFRTVECRLVDGGMVMMDTTACKGPKPASKETCICGGSEVCSVGFCPLELPATAEAPASAPSASSFEEVGCFASTGTAAATELNDWTCFQWTDDNVKCSGGLPFYAKQGSTAQDCADFCSSKALDIFGLEGATCRCGASALNKNIWRLKAPPPGLVFEAHRLTPDETCPLKVYRHDGFYESGGIPASLWRLQETDIEYMDSIVSGRVFGEVDEEGVGPSTPRRAFFMAPKGSSPQAQMTKEKDSQNSVEASKASPPNYKRNCWPSNCASGNGPWPTRTTRTLADRKDKWKDYVRVPYSFSGFIPKEDKSRRFAFRKAVSEIAMVTCIQFEEYDSFPSRGTDYVRVTIDDKESCHVDGEGGVEKLAKINMGTCNSDIHLGNILHELLHVLGLEHTMQRPDAHGTYHGQGPFLTIRWDNLEASAVKRVKNMKDHLKYLEEKKLPKIQVKWQHLIEGEKHQFEEEPDAYMGSADDGPGDPHVGYAKYDFTSVMHYAEKDEFGAVRFEIPAKVKAKLSQDQVKYIAQRINLMDSDIIAINDMYQCKPCDGPGDSIWFKDANGFNCDYWSGKDCETEKTGFFDRYKYNAEQMAEVRRNCKKACGNEKC